MTLRLPGPHHRRAHDPPLEAPELEHLRAPASLDTWLSVFARLLRVPDAKRREISAELAAHLRERIRDLMLQGADEADALRSAIGELGEAADLAHRFERANTFSQRRLLMNLGMLGLAAGAVTVSTIMAANLPAGGNAANRSVFQQAPAQEEPPAWFAEKRGFSMSGEATMADAVGLVTDNADMPVVVHWNDLEERDVTRETPVNATFSDVSFQRALDLIVNSVEPDWSAVTWRIIDGTLEIGTREGFDKTEIELAVYDISRIAWRLTEDYSYEHEDAVNSVTDLLIAFVSPEDWQDNGGALAHLNVVGGDMFVEAPRRMHTRIQWILDQLERGDDDDLEAQLEVDAEHADTAQPGQRIEATLRPGSPVSIEIFELTRPGEWFRASRRVEADGNIRLPAPIGSVPATGKSVAEVETWIIDFLDGTYINDPIVSVYTPVDATGDLSHTTYTVQEGDTLALIAARLLGDETEAARIVQANPRLAADNGATLRVGERIAVPVSDMP